MSEHYTKLTAPFPPDAMYLDKSRGESRAFVVVTPQYVVERMNEVFGPDGWSESKPEFSEDSEGVLCICNVCVHTTDATRSGVGYAKFKEGGLLGDTYKAAATDAFKKAVSHFGVGNDIYKGLVKPKDLANPVNTEVDAVVADAKPKRTRRSKFAVSTKELTAAAEALPGPQEYEPEEVDSTPIKVANPNKLISSVLKGAVK